MNIVLVQSNEIREADFIKDLLEELFQARRKFPSQNALTTFVALVEEVGELGEVVLMLDNPATNKKNKTIFDLHKEALQVATMAMRVLLDCGLVGTVDTTIDDFFDDQFPGLQMTAEEKMLDESDGVPGEAV